MAKYIYPAVFTREGELYSVNFPDFESCYTCGDSLADAFEMAEDVLAFTLYQKESSNERIPLPSDQSSISVPADSFVNLVACDTLAYQKRNNTRAVKKTLSIPEWLNELAIAADLNFSQVLQDALKERLQV